MPPCLVLVVDDDAGIRESVKDVLKDEGYFVATATDGVAALKVLEQLKPNAILLDLMMPGMDGFEFRRGQIADKRLADIPTIIMTASGKAGDVARGRGPLFFVGKPFRVLQLVETVRRAVRAAALPG